MQEVGKIDGLNGKRIGIFGKGGAGKSTVTFLLAKAIRKLGYTVVVLDADSTNLGLHRIFEIENPPKPLMEHFGGTVFSGGLVTCPVDDPSPLNNAEVKLEDLSPLFYGRSPEGIFLFIIGKIGDEGPGAGCDGPVAKIARDFRVSVNEKSQVTLIDFKAGLEDTARGVVTSLDLGIFVLDPTLVSVEMASNMKQIVSQIQSHEPPATAHLESPELIEWAKRFYRGAHIEGVRYVLNRVNSKEEEGVLKKSLREKGIKTSCTIFQTPMISNAWLKGIAIKTGEQQLEIDKFVSILEEDLAVDKWMME